MSRIFISHSSQNNPAALALARWLELHGWDDYFLDISSDRGLAPGERWQEALKAAADRCEAVIFLLSPAWRQSRWCLAEFLLAQQLGKTIIGVLIESLPLAEIPAEMTAQWQLCNLVEGTDRIAYRVGRDPIVPPAEISFAMAGLEHLEIGLRRAGLDPSTFPWPPPEDAERPPYHGLEALDATDAPVFFGREAAIINGLDALRRLRAGATERLFVIVGASGAGKSSFLRAGLLARLKRDDRNFLTLPVVRPEKAPLEGPNGLIPCLDSAFRSLKVQKNWAAIRVELERLWGFTELLAELQEAAHRRSLVTGQPPTVVLPIDQGEELFAAEDRAQADQFLNLLRTVLAPQGHGRSPLAREHQVPIVLLAIRSDSYEALQHDRHLQHVKPFLFSLPPIPKEGYKAIVEGPAARHSATGRSLTIDPRLSERLLADSAGADALPLLAFTLERLLREHGADGHLTLEDYEALGGVGGSIQAAIEAALTDPRRPPQIPADDATRRRLLRRAFVPWLARVDPDTDERKRRLANWSEIPAECRPLLDRLVEQRLLVRDRRPKEDGTGNTVVIEVAHEALLRRWPLLAQWLSEDSEALKAIDGAVRAAAEWQRRGRREAWLVHTGERLRNVEALLESSAYDQLLGPDGRLYLHACRERHATQVRQQEKRRERERQQEERARQAEQLAEQERLRLAQLEAAQAAERADAARRLSRRTLVGAAVASLLMIVALILAWRAEEQQTAAELTLGASDFAEAARRRSAGEVGEATARLARAVRLDPQNANWRVSLIQALTRYPWAYPEAEIRLFEQPSIILFSPDGDLLLVAAGDLGRLWDVRAGRKVADLEHLNDVLVARFCAGGRSLVTGSRDRRARVWRSEDGQLLDERKFDGIVEALHCIDQDGADQGLAIVAGVYQQDWYAWDTATGKDLIPPLVDGTGARAASNGRYVVASRENAVELWDAQNGTSGKLEIPQPGWNFEVFSPPDGEKIYLTSSDGLFAIDPETLAVSQWASSRVGISFGGGGRQAMVFWGDRNAVPSLGPDDASFRSAIHFADGDLVEAKISADGERVVTSWSAQSYRKREGPAPFEVQLWDTREGVEIQPGLDRSSARPALVCPGGSRFITQKATTFQTWDGRSGEPVGPALVFSGTETGALKTDSQCRFAAAAVDQEVHVWSLETGDVISAPLAHGSKVLGMTFSPDVHYLATRTAEAVHLWNVQTSAAQPRTIDPSQGFENVWRRALVVSPDGRFLAGNFDDEVVVRPLSDISQSISTGLFDENRGDHQSIESLAFSENGKSLVVDEVEGKFRVYSIEDRTWIEPFQLGWRGRLVLAPDGLKVVFIHSKSAYLVDLDGVQVGQPLHHRQQIVDAAFSPDGTRVATASMDGTARVWSARTGKPQGDPVRHQSGLSRVMWSGDGRLLLTTGLVPVTLGDKLELDEREIRVWTAVDGSPVAEALLLEETLGEVRINHDGDRAVRVNGGVATLWNPTTGELVGRPLRHETRIDAVAFSPDGQRLLTLAGSTVYLWDALLALSIGLPLEHPTDVDQASFLADGQIILVQGAWAKRIWLWDVSSASAEDVPLLAELAELLSGYRMTELGALAAIPSQARRLETLRRRLETSRDGESTPGERIARWLLQSPEARPPSPMAAASAGATSEPLVELAEDAP